MLMGLWGWAELAIGIIVGCLPVMPKFFQHIGPKVLKTLSFSSKHEMSLAHGLKNTQKTPKAKAFTKTQRPFAKYVGPSICESSTDPYSPHAQLHGDYVMPDKFDSQLPQAFIAHETTQLPGVIIATRRDDLEYGQNRS